jgi:hypothetical protein
MSSVEFGGRADILGFRFSFGFFGNAFDDFRIF